LQVVAALASGPTRSGANLISDLVRSTTTGLLLMASCVAVATTWGMCEVMPGRAYLADRENSPRRNGRIGAALGAVAGTALGLHAVRAMGITGYSAAGISSGLAALGNFVGGGMAVGINVVIALPALLAALGYAVYRTSREADRSVSIARRTTQTVVATYCYARASSVQDRRTTKLVAPIQPHILQINREAASERERELRR
jgi:hypothetical protein